MTYLAIGCACLVSVVFAASAVSKMRGRTAYGEFTEAVRTLLPALRGRRFLASATAITVAVAEAAAAVLTAVPATAQAGFALAAALLAAFSVAIASALRRKVDAPCRCFATSSAPLSPRHLVRNGLLLAAALAGLATAGGGLTGADPAGLAVAAVAGLVVAVLLMRIDDLIELFASPALGGDRAQGGTRHDHPRRRSDPGRRAVPAGSAADVRRHPQAPGAHRTPGGAP